MPRGENPDFIKNRKPWAKGQSGNPAGRKAGSKNKATYVNEVLDTIYRDKTGKIKSNPLNTDDKSPMEIEKAMVIRQAIKALGGDRAAFEKLMNIRYGKDPDIQAFQGANGEPVDPDFRIVVVPAGKAVKARNAKPRND